MGNIGVATAIIIVANILFSYKGFKDYGFFSGYKFEVGPILARKDYKRLITSGFLHADWIHLIMNMYTLFAFGSIIEFTLKWPLFLVIYFSSLIGGNLLALFIYRNKPEYSAIGASGAVSGLIFACIALFPGIQITFMPSLLFGLLFVAISIYGIKSKKGNIGHEAHLGGALIGMLVAIAFRPEVLQTNLLPIVVISIPTIIFVAVITFKPNILLPGGGLFKAKNQEIDHYDIDHRYNAEKNQQQQEVDRILDKINNSGANSLTDREKETLRNHTR
jgi:membrane associated rhomboid family serine protease